MRLVTPAMCALFAVALGVATTLALADDQACEGIECLPAAEAGDAEAQHKLSRAHYDGESYAKAVWWYRLAAVQVEADALYFLGSMYLSGRGVAKDYVEAHRWFNLAAVRKPAGNRDAAASARDGVATHFLTPEQVLDAQRLAREWRPKTWEELSGDMDIER